jgi:hypothetical protein
MDPEQITQHIIAMLDGVDVVQAAGVRFFCYDPGRDLPPDRRLPFATIVTSDAHDHASDLDRPEVFRLNIGVSRESYVAMFGPPPPGPVTVGPVETGYDYTRLDVVMPHPIYASLSWVCVLNPSDTTFALLDPLLREAHAIAVGRRARHGGQE